MKQLSPFDFLTRDVKHSLENLNDIEACNRLLSESKKTGKPILFVNAYSCYLAKRDPEYLKTLEGSICLLDGKPLTRLVKSITKREVLQTRGIDFFSLVAGEYSKAQRMQLLYGSTMSTCQEISNKLSAKSGAKISYVCPPSVDRYKFDSKMESKSLSHYNAEILWIALGTPKQDIIASGLAAFLEMPVVAVGAAFDFYANPRTEAPKWVRFLYLEWLFRLMREPKRLWKRYLVGNTFFLLDYITWRFLARRGTN